MNAVLLQVSTYKNELQGQNGPGFSWALFDSSTDAAAAAAVTPRATSSTSFTFTDDDARRVCIDALPSTFGQQFMLVKHNTCVI